MGNVLETLIKKLRPVLAALQNKELYLYQTINNNFNNLCQVTKQTTQTTTEQQLKTAIQFFFEAIRWKISINTANQNLGCAFYKGAHYKLVNLALGCNVKNIL